MRYLGRISKRYFFADSPIVHLERFAASSGPFFAARAMVRAYYFFVLFIAVGLFTSWDPSMGAEARIASVWPLFWVKYVDFEFAYALIRVSFIAAALYAAFSPGHRLARALSFVALFEFASLYMSILQWDVDSYGFILASFLLIFLPGDWDGETPGARAGFLGVFWGVQAVNLLTYTMVGLGKLVGAAEQLAAGTSHLFLPQASALLIADRLIVTNADSALGAWAVEHYLLVWPYFLATVYISLVAFLVAFRPVLHRTWGLLLIIYHIGNYLVINIAFSTHIFLWAILLLGSPFAPRYARIADILRALPFLDILVRRLFPRNDTGT